ncbi:MAG: hypothetical protein N2691_02680 [Patescibacteria group bacterium]|nr:hypothetical protein [Patescibacteria group bacterium]
MHPASQNQANQLQGARFSLELAALVAGLLLVAIPTAQLLLFKDDHVHIFPALLKDYASHFSQFTYDYGLTRPLGLLYFYAIYTLSLASLPVAHLVQYALHATAAIILFLIFSKHLEKLTAALIALLVVVLPFFSEQYGWFAAGNASLALLILICQIVVLDSKKLGIPAKMVALVALQFAGVLLYEILFFTFIPLVFALLISTKPTIKGSKIFSAILLFIPSLTYYILRTVIFPSHSGLAREMPINANIIATALSNLATMANNLFFLFFARGSIEFFWAYNLSNGVLLIISNGLLLLTALAVAGLSVLAMYKSHLDYQPASKVHQSESVVLNPVFWIFLSVTSILPALLLINPALPFRVIALPLYAAIIAVVIMVYKYSRSVALGIVAFLVVFFTPVSISILDQMRLVALDDERHFIQIVEGVNKIIDEDELVAVQLVNMPSSTRTNFTYGEYLSACASSYWCLQAGVNRRSGSIGRVYVGKIDQEPELRVIPFKYDPQTRSLVLSSNTGKEGDNSVH